jgi:hypothetical protein
MCHHISTGLYIVLFYLIKNAYKAIFTRILKKEKSGITKSKEHLGRPASSRNGDSVAKLQAIVTSDQCVMI